MLMRTDVEDALWKERTLVKTSLMRQTIHLIPADEFSLYIRALRRSRIDAVLRVMARVGVSADEGHALTGHIMDAVRERALGHADIRAAVRPKVSKRVQGWMDKVWSIVRIPVSEGLLCYGPGEGNTVRFIRSDQWLKKSHPKPADENDAQRALLGKYLRAYGPATLSDFAHWSGLPSSQVRPLRQLCAEDLVDVQVDSEARLLHRDDVKCFHSKKNAASCVRLLPHFDPYLLAHQEKGHLLAQKDYKRVYRNQGWISPVLLVDGWIAGTWSHKSQGSRLQVSIEPFTRLARATRDAIALEAESLAGFFGAALKLMIGSNRA